MSMIMPKGKYMCTVRVGEKGQIVIPKQAREMFGIEPGDNLLLLADEERGIAIVRPDEFGFPEGTKACTPSKRLVYIKNTEMLLRWRI